MPNIYLAQPDLLSHVTSVRAVKNLDDGGYAIALHENIIRPEGGGQPRDHAALTFGRDEVPAGEVFKSDGDTWITLDAPLAQAPEIGEMVHIAVDADRRRSLSRAHSLSHILMAAARHVTKSFDSKGAFLGEDGKSVEIRFRIADQLSQEALATIDCLARTLIHAARPIQTVTVKSAEIGARQFPHWRVDPDLHLTRKIRVVHILGVDANPCSGSHVVSTGAIGSFAVKGCRLDGTGAHILTAEITSGWTY
jgi:Ser-tRNA(Ala) deacylase AlaX